MRARFHLQPVGLPCASSSIADDTHIFVPNVPTPLVKLPLSSPTPFPTLVLRRRILPLGQEWMRVSPKADLYAPEPAIILDLDRAARE